MPVMWAARRGSMQSEEPWPKQGDIYWADLDPTRGVEMQKPRPVVIVSARREDPLLLIVPGTSSRPDREYEHVVRVRRNKNTNGLDDTKLKYTYFQCRHMRSIDMERLCSSRKGGLLDEEMWEVMQGVRYCLGLDFVPVRERAKRKRARP
jgi:mRNA-degrading endonuclease toxin of MazEF toxin-antitoxin module